MMILIFNQANHDDAIDVILWHILVFYDYNITNTYFFVNKITVIRRSPEKTVISIEKTLRYYAKFSLCAFRTVSRMILLWK